MKKFSISFLLPILILLIFDVRHSAALTSNCLKVLHMQAITDAISITPPELKAILKEQESAMHKQVNKIHATAPSNRQSLSVYFKDITTEMKSIDPKRLDFLSRMMTHITIYPFMAYSPIKMYEACDDSKVLNSVSVIYDGFNSKAASAQYPESYKYESKQDLIKLQQFYSILVNDISDLWVSMWKEAGKDIAGLPQTATLVRGQISEVKTPVVTTLEPRAKEGQNSSGTYTDGHLNKYQGDAEAHRRMYDVNKAVLDKGNRDYNMEKMQRGADEQQREQQKAAEESRAAEKEERDNIHCYTVGSGGVVSGGTVFGGIVSGGSVSGMTYQRICKDKRTGKIISKERI